MSDPFRDHAAKEAMKREEKIIEEYTPMVFWVKDPPRGTYNYVYEELTDLPGVQIVRSDVPFKSLDVKKDEIEADFLTESDD